MAISCEFTWLELVASNDALCFICTIIDSISLHSSHTTYKTRLDSTLIKTSKWFETWIGPTSEITITTYNSNCTKEVNLGIAPLSHYISFDFTHSTSFLHLGVDVCDCPDTFKCNGVGCTIKAYFCDENPNCKDGSDEIIFNRWMRDLCKVCFFSEQRHRYDLRTLPA